MAKRPKVDKQVAQEPTRYRLRTASLGGPCDGIDLDKALTLAGSLEDAERARRLFADRKP